MRYGLSDQISNSSKQTSEKTARTASKVGKEVGKRAGKKAVKEGVKKGAQAAASSTGIGALLAIGIEAADQVAEKLQIKKAIKGFVALMLSLVILMPLLFSTNTIGLSFNPWTHINEKLHPGSASELGESTSDIQSEDLKYAKIIAEYMQEEYNDLEEYIKAECEAKGIDYEASRENIVDNTVIPLISASGGGVGGELIAQTAEKMAFPEGTPKSEYCHAKGAKPTSAIADARDKYCPDWDNDKISCCCHSTSVILSAVFGKKINSLLINTSSESEAISACQKILSGLDFDIFPYDGNESSLRRGDVLSFVKSSGGHTYIYLGDSRICEGSRGSDEYSNIKSNQNQDDDMSKYQYFIVMRHKGSGGGDFASKCAEWCKKIAADNKYGYKHYGSNEPYSHYCPLCVPGSGDGWNCIGFAWAAWKHGAGIDSKCSCDVINDSTGDRLVGMSDAEASKVVTKNAGVDCDVHVDKSGIPVSDIQPGDILLGFEGNTYAHMLICVEPGKYADSGSWSSKKEQITYGRDLSKSGYNYKVRIRYKGAGSTGASFSPQSSYKVLEKITQETGTVHQIGCANSPYKPVAQSFAYTGKDFAVSFTDGPETLTTGVVKLYSKEGSSTGSQATGSIYHANGSSMSDEGTYLSGGQYTSSATEFDVASGVSLKGNRTLPTTSKAQAYDKDTKKLIIDDDQIKVFSGSTLEKTISKAHTGSYRQDMGAAGGYIFACYTDSKESGINKIHIYSESGGEYCGTYEVTGGELESCDVVDGELVLLVHEKGGGDNYIQFTGIKVGSGTSSLGLDPALLARSRDCMTILSGFSVYEAQLFPTIPKTTLEGIWFLVKQSKIGRWIRDIKITRSLKTAMKNAVKQAKKEEKPAFFDIMVVEETTQKTVQRETGKKPTSWNLVLVNRDNAVPSGYGDDLTDISEYSSYSNARVDSRIYKDLKKMIEDCEKESGDVVVVSAYRTKADQQKIYDSDPDKSLVMEAGHSEHETGLAVDILAGTKSNMTPMDESQESQEAQKWLMDNCQNYGFILRYPKNKEDKTKVGYEPWHYRYVGKDHAEKITKRGQCLEEYVGTETKTVTANVSPLIEINPADTDRICEIFDMDPDAKYSTEAAKKKGILSKIADIFRKKGEKYDIGETNVETAIETNTDTHMALLYDNINGQIPQTGEKLVLPIKTLFTKIKLSKKFKNDKKGIECKVTKKTKIYASERGLVRKVKKNDSKLGNYVVIEGDFRIVYAHLNKIYVKEGEMADRNEVIGNVTKKFRMEVYENGSPVDPEPLFIKRKYKNASAGAGVVSGRRRSAPERGNKYYESPANNYPRNWAAGHGGNCTWYAWGRFMEIQGRTDLPSLGGDAYSWQYTDDYEKGKTPKLGAIIVWDYGTGANGHVAVVEEVKSNGDIEVTESGWGSSGNGYLFKERSYKAPNYPGHGTFVCFIYPKYPVTSGSANVEGGTKGDYQKYAASLFSEYGWSESELEPLIELWNRESGWNPKAENSSSGAYGIPQALPGSKMKSAGSDWKTNPETQIKWGLKYIKNRYGSPSEALKHHDKNNWY